MTIIAIQWKFNDIDIKTVGSKYSMDANRLTVRNVDGADEGEYSCVVTNQQNQTTEVEVMCLYVVGELHNFHDCICSDS